MFELGNKTYREANVLFVRDVLTSTPYFKICLTLQLCLGISAILSNSIVLGFYIKQKAGVVSTMYRLVQSPGIFEFLSVNEVWNESFCYVSTFNLIDNLSHHKNIQWIGSTSTWMNQTLILIFSKNSSSSLRFLSSCDLITGLSSFLYIPALYLMQGNAADLEMIYFALRIVSVITIITAKVSIFFNVVLAVIRTINIRTPFYSINARLVIICAIVYPVFWVVTVGCLFFKEPGELTLLTSKDLATLFITQLHPALNTKVNLDFILLVLFYLGIPLILPTGKR